MEWVWDPHPSDTEYTADFAYLLRDAHGAVRVEWDRHLNGLFARDQWTRWLASAGFSPDVREASYEVDAGGGELPGQQALEPAGDRVGFVDRVLDSPGRDAVADGVHRKP